MEVWPGGWCPRYPWHGSCSCLSTAAAKRKKNKQRLFCLYQQISTDSNTDNVIGGQLQFCLGHGDLPAVHGWELRQCFHRNKGVWASPRVTGWTERNWQMEMERVSCWGRGWCSGILVLRTVLAYWGLWLGNCSVLCDPKVWKNIWLSKCNNGPGKPSLLTE